MITWTTEILTEHTWSKRGHTCMRRTWTRYLPHMDNHGRFRYTLDRALRWALNINHMPNNLQRIVKGIRLRNRVTGETVPLSAFL